MASVIGILQLSIPSGKSCTGFALRPVLKIVVRSCAFFVTYRGFFSRGTFRQKLSIQRDDLKGLPDPDQGYCSFSEAKRESPDSIPSPGPEPAGYERPEQRSFSVSAGELKANHGAVLRRRKENASTSALARTTDSRKS